MFPDGDEFPRPKEVKQIMEENMNRSDSVKTYGFSMSNKQYRIKRKMGVPVLEQHHGEPCGPTLH